MSNLKDYLIGCFINGHIDLRKVMERCSVSFDNLSLDDIRFVESECRELRRKFEDAEKVDCFKTYRLQPLGFCDTAYYSLDEHELVKKLACEQVNNENFDFEVEKIRISQDVLNGHIRDRKEWEK